MAVTKFQDLDLADEDRKWDGDAAEKRVRKWAGADDEPNEKYRDAHVWWATGFHASLPFLDESLIHRRNEVPLRYAGGIVPAGLEKLYYIGLAAPRGPQIPVYGVQTKLAIRMIALHEAAGAGGAGVQAYLAGLQEADDRIDIVRNVWNDQMADTERLLDALAVIQSTRPLQAAPA